MKLVLILRDGETKEQAQSILDEIEDKMYPDYPEIVEYKIEE